MPLTLMMLAADSLTILSGAYWVCLIVGGGLVALTLLSGHDGDADASGGLDVDVHADVEFDTDGALGADLDGTEALHAHDALDTHAADADHGHGLALSSWLSLRFLVYFAATFGAFGVVLRYMTELNQWTTFAIALLSGLIVGQGVHQLLRVIRQTSGDSATRPQDYVRKLARVTIAIRQPAKGEIALQVRNAERYVPAVAVGPVKEFATGAEVVVVGYRGGVAQVVSRVEFERRARST